MRYQYALLIKMRDSGSIDATVHADLDTSISLQTSQDGRPTVQLLHSTVMSHGLIFVSMATGSISRLTDT